LAQLLRRSGDVVDDRNRKQMVELFRRMIFNILMDNTDDHEKNHALFVKYRPVRPGSAIRTVQLELTPAYDVLPTNSGQGHQEFGIGDRGHESSLENAMTRCRLFGLTPPEAAAEVVKVIAVVDTWQEHFTACSVSAADILELAGRIDSDDLLSQRKGFRVDAFPDVPPQTRRSPFS
jgi:serine/threonine-protein kinase HipA